MKKKQTASFFERIKAQKLILKMKLTFFILMACLMQVSATAYSQATKFSFNIQGRQVFDVLKEIEGQSKFRFVYQREQIDVTRKVDLNVTDETVETILKKLFVGQDISCKVLQDNLIVIIPGTTGQSGTVQQSRPVSGKVTDSSGAPLPGVTVVIEGTTSGTVTGVDGGFSLSNVSDKAVLVFSFVGMKTEQVPVHGRQTVNIVLEEEKKDLDEVIVIGYGTARRQDYSGSVSSVKLENSMISLSPNLNPLETLKGNVAGLNVGAVNSAGGEPSMIIRGQNSINGSNTPLIVLDGVIYMGSLSSINPNDIATVDVLKDATSSAAYGSRSANGIIAITTKQGRTGKPTISFNTSLGVQEWQNKPEMLRGEAWIKMVNDRNKYAPGSINWMRPGELANYEAGKETVWLDEVSRQGIMQNYQAAVSGANENVNYYMSVSYDDNKSIVVGDRFNRISLLGKMNTTITKWLEVGIDGAFAKRDYFGGAASLSAAQMMSPYGVMYRDDQGNLEKYPYTESAINPLWGVDDGTRDREEVHHEYRLNLRTLIKVPWVNGLTYRVNYLLTQNQAYFGNFFYESYHVGEGDSPSRYEPSTIQGFLSRANGSIDNHDTYSYVLDNIVNYKQSFGPHFVDATLVATRDFLRNQVLTSTGSDFAANGNTALGIQGLHKATVQQINIQGHERANVGYLGRLSYSFADRYFFTGSYRRDGASVFGADNKWANFWAGGVAWKVTNESFMKSFTALNNLKMKFSWGQNGNQGIGPYATLSAVANAASGGIQYEFSHTPGTIYYGLYQSSLGNSHLGWETTSSWNTGFESAWLKNRVFLDVNVYFSRTTDQIFSRQIPIMTGFPSMMASMGQVNNTGIETTLRTVNLKRNEWEWSTSVTYWKNFNKLVSLYGEDLNGDGKEDDDLVNNLFIGKSLGSIYGYKQIGIVQQDDTDYIQLTGAAPGSPKYQDMDGEPGITANDRTILGNGKVSFRLSLNNSVSYRNTELYVLITGAFGGNNYFVSSNTQAYMTSGTNRPYDNTHYIPYWTPENPTNTHPSATFAGDGRFLGLQSRGFVRIQDVVLSHTFKKIFLDKVGIKYLRVYASAKNLATFTDWIGGDPEVGSRMRENGLPVASTYSLGFNLNF